MRWTEAQIEAWLIPETRSISTTKGDSIEVTQTALFWICFDYLVDKCFFRVTSLVDVAIDDAEKENEPFWKILPRGIFHTYKGWYEVYGEEGCASPDDNPYR